MRIGFTATRQRWNERVVALKRNLVRWREGGALLGVLVAAVCAGAASAPSSLVDTLNVGQALPRAALLTAGVHRYARYLISDDSRNLIDLWSRRAVL
jgi:hypothetical protein